MKSALVAFLLAGLRLGPGEVPRTAGLTGLLPASEAGAKASGQPRLYSSDLYQYIDGGAEAFHNYDMVAMVHQEYRMRDVELTVDIYDMGNPLNAFGVYSSERSPSARFLPIGAECSAGPLALNFWQGRYYVKLSAFGQEQNTTSAMESFAKAISKRIGPDLSLPSFYSLFPERNRVPRSYTYVKRAPLGYAFLEPAYTARYQIGGRETQLVLSQAPNPEGAKQRSELVMKHFSETGKVRAWPQVRDAFRGGNQLEGEWLFFPRGRYAVILINPPASPRALLNELLTKIP